MAEVMTTIGDFSITVSATSGVTPSRGARLKIASDGTYGLAPIGEIGQGFAVNTFATSGGRGTMFPVNKQGTVVAIASEAIAVGDDVFSAASGKCSTTATSAVFIGRAKSAAAADGDLFELIVGGPVPV